MSVYLAHDGSLNGEWVGRYALRFAAGTPARRLVQLHVEDANISGPPLHERLARIKNLGERLGVSVETRILPMHHGVFGGLDVHLKEDPESLVICGARATDGRRGLLRGTISERLLGNGGYDVMSVRVLQPGLLGHPKRIMLSLSKDGRASTAIRFVAPLVAGIEQLDIVYINTVSRMRYAHISEDDAARLRHQARGIAERAEGQIIAATGIDGVNVDFHGRLSDDWPKQTAVEAGRYRSDLTLAEFPPTQRQSLGFAHPIEQLMRLAPSDVAVFRAAAEKPGGS